MLIPIYLVLYVIHWNSCICDRYSKSNTGLSGWG